MKNGVALLASKCADVLCVVFHRGDGECKLCADNEHSFSRELRDRN